MAVSSAQFRALDAVERCPHGPCVLSVPALGAGQAARVAREGGSRARLASGTGRGFVALRGGSGRYDGDSRRYIDAQLRGEILEDAFSRNLTPEPQDAERVSKGKLPMFMENIGKTFSGAGAFQFEVGLEAQVPGDIGLDEDEEALQDATVEEAPPPVPVLSPEELEARKVHQR
ncbi:hypothetical protein T484DRAFT_1743865 [Baffinella frigidus]|nr:hypothetical protein T484DRAFT_1743865 [Cryptophyta sp. CCMP2293]